jgi:glycosyltransferase involved in cell wall biosynthesis
LDAYGLIAQKIQSWRLVLVGTKTDYRYYLEQYASTLGISESVIFIDPIFGSEKNAAYHAAEIIVIPSIKDAMTIIAPEAAICSKPVLITKTSGFGALVNAGGAIEVEATIVSIAEKLLLMCNGEVDLKLMGQLGRKFVSENFDWKFLAKKYYSIFNSCLN